ncbi:hypothetical protein V4S40_06825 [Enterococcus cecorum]
METSTQLKLRMMLSQIQRQVSAQKLGLSAQQLAQLDQQVPLTVNKVTVNDQVPINEKTRRWRSCSDDYRICLHDYFILVYC